MAAFHLLLIAFHLLMIVDGQLAQVDEEPTAVTLIPSDEIIFVGKGQILVLMCQIQGPAVRNCSWELNGVVRMLDNITIENRLVNTEHYGKCRIAMKVTPEDIGKWTCNILTDAVDARPKSATTQVSLFQGKPKTIAGLVTIVLIGVIIFTTYVISFTLLKICRFDHKRNFKGKKKKKVSKKRLVSAVSRGSSRESSDQFEEDVAMTTNPA
ncbi:uncharacterized protein LOC124350756 isoform X1 [Daphnia pulicaria]|uniref:uncharacterized protein LOC124350756 isoform X1 n=1 Tax=Daphnia pulicaria TaxID=35523 RepID=UPI001EEBF4B2|nr:uncharacterized protein LOC124350756 isoform X1 [Daphnia pulicaria]